MTGRLVPLGLSALCLSASLLVTVGQADEPAQPAGAYFHDANGRVSVTLDAQAFVVKLRGAPRQAGGRPAFLPAYATGDQLPEPAAQLESRLAARGLHVVRGGDAAAIRARADVEYVLPLLYREGSEFPIYPTGRVIAAFRPEVTDQQIEQLAADNGCDVRPLPRGERRFAFTLREPDAERLFSVANALHEAPGLTHYAHPDFFLPMVAMSPPVIQDPLYISHQWHLDGDVAKGAAPNSDINVEAAWDTNNGAFAEGRPEIRVSILDECVERMHPDLFPNWAAGIDLDNDPPDDDPSPDGGQRHGTSCAGVAVAAGNTIGVRGAAPKCGLIGVKFFGASVAEIAEGFYFSVDPDNNGDDSDGAAVLSNSWGFADGTLAPTDVVASINAAASTGRNGLGCLVLFASANNDHTVNGVSALAQLASVMAVGGTNSNTEHTEFSDVGPEVGIATPTNDRGDDGVRLPWIDITTVDNTGSSGYNGLPDLDYTNAFGGTSSATPLAAGILGLILSQDLNMTAAQARAILQHTAARIDEPFGRFDPVTGHSHRYGFGRADAGQAVTAAHAGTRWPDRIKNLNATGTGSNVSLFWDIPTADYAGSLLVRSALPITWSPTDGQSFNVGDMVAPGVQVIYSGTTPSYVDVGASTGPFFYAVYAFSTANRWSFGAKNHQIRNSVNVFFDNSETTDPGWTHGGANDEWTRGTPTSGLGFGQNVVGSGPLAGTRGTRAINGNRCWGTDLTSTYDANADAWLATPVINLTGVTLPVFLEYYDWCMLETFYDRCSIEVADAADNLLGVIEPDTGGDYDWTRRIYDITAFAGQPIKIRFRIQSDGALQRDGWFLDDIRVVVAGPQALPPAASDVYAETPENTPRFVTLTATDPNPGDILSYVIASLPANAELRRTNGDPIASVPYVLPNQERVVQVVPAMDFQGPDEFNYHANDGTLDSNTARVRLSIGTPQPVAMYPMDTDPGWLREGAWAFGQPQGLGGDPTSGSTGTNVFGYNLAGQYPNNLPARYLTLLPINCTGLSRVTLKFARWLGVESSSFDKATIEASNDGVVWTTIWSNAASNLQETAWSQQTVSVGVVAENQPFVLIRFGMGPTDAADTFSGWNIDDVQVLAIGTPTTNAPPVAVPVSTSTAIDTPVNVVLSAIDPNDDPLSFTITQLPAHGQLSDPNGGVIAAAPYTLLSKGDEVVYLPDVGHIGADSFNFRAADATLPSNIATATVTSLSPAPFPLNEDWEAGPPPAVYWSVRSTGPGRARIVPNNGPIGQYHFTMDSASDSTVALNELDLVIDLEGRSNVLLRYDWKEFGEEVNQLPASWTGSLEGDGVAISQDGVRWHLVDNLHDGTAAYANVTLDLDAAAAAAGLTYNRTFRIRFQQYDNFPIDTDGIALDNIRVEQGTGDPTIVTESLPDGRVGDPYGPTALSVVGGDPPLVFTAPASYEEQAVGSNQFAMVGGAQNWNGNNSVFDYAFPPGFEFPFYGEMQTAVRVGTDGWLNFGPHVGSTWNNSDVLLQFNKRIAPLWEDLRTDEGGNIFVDSSAPGQLTFRWVAKVVANGTAANFSCTLFADGRIRFDYGEVAPNAALAPTIGVSSGDQTRYLLASYNSQGALNNAGSLLMKPLQVPLGVTLSNDGMLTGTPTLAGTFEAVYRVVDQMQRVDTRRLSITIVPAQPGDLDGDNDVDGSDFSMFLAAFGSNDGDESFLAAVDYDHDDAVTFVDYQTWLGYYRAFVGIPSAPPPQPADLADMNADQHVDGDDVAGFARAVIQPASTDFRGRFVSDMNGDGQTDLQDVPNFIDRLLERSGPADIE